MKREKSHAFVNGEGEAPRNHSVVPADTSFAWRDGAVEEQSQQRGAVNRLRRAYPRSCMRCGAPLKFSGTAFECISPVCGK